MSKESEDEGYIIIPRAWLKDIAEKQNKIITLLENIAGYDLKKIAIFADYLNKNEQGENI